MWDFLGKIAEQHGLAALISLGVLAAFAYAVFLLWRDSRGKADAMRKQEVAHTKAISAKDVVIAEMSGKHSARVEKIKSKHSDELRFLTEQFTKRIDEIQERRVDETRQVTTAVVEHVERVKQSVEKSTGVLETLRDLLMKG